MWSLAPLVLLLISSCCCPKLSLRTEYITEASLASSHVGTPDPRLNCPPAGQRLIVSWYIPSALWHGQTLHLDITIRFRDNQEWHQTLAIQRPIGTFAYEVTDEEFLKCGGILTYKALLWEEEQLLESWYHPLWQERITF